MEQLFSIFGDVSHTKLGGADTFADQLNCKYTVYILTIITILSTTKVFVDEPIYCFCPEKFTDSQVNYANRLCWTKNTHYVSNNITELPKPNDPNKKHVTYYQWIPLFLVFQAILFYTPRFIWRKMSRRCGMTVSHVTDSCIECQRNMDNEASEKIMAYVTKYMVRFLGEVKQIYKTNRIKQVYWKVFRQAYLTKMYIVIKIIYSINVLSQLFLLNSFLGNDYHFYGIDVIKRLITRQPWKTSDRFPRVTICDIHIRALANIHRYSMQCVLPMNLFYEIFFIFLWFWFVFVCITTLSSLLYWIVVAVYKPHSLNYIKRCLISQNKVDREHLKNLPTFVYNYLRKDGCLVVKLVSKNSNDIVTSEFISNLWEHYLTTLGGKGFEDKMIKMEKEVDVEDSQNINYKSPDYKY